MKPFRPTAALLACAALVGACASSGYYSAPIRSNPVTGARWQDPETFKREAFARADWLQRQVEADADVGRVPPAALDELRAERRRLDALLADASRDGRIDARERDRVHVSLDRMGRAGRRPGVPGVYGGGPRAIDSAGQHLYQNNWRRAW